MIKIQKKICGRYILPAFFLLLFCCCAFAEESQDTSVAKEETSSEDSQNVSPQNLWDVLFTNKLKELESINTSVNTLLGSLPNLSNELDKKLVDIKEEYRHVISLASVSKGLPTEMTVVADWLQRLQEHINFAMNPIEGPLNDIKFRFDEVSAIDETSADIEGTEDYLAFIKQKTQIQNQINDIQKRINRVLRSARSTVEKIQKQHDQILESIPSLWEDYYLDRTGQFYDWNTWSKLGNELSVLRETFVLRLGSDLPRNLMDWLTVLWRILMVTIPLVLIGSASRHFAKFWSEPIKKGWLRLSSHSLPILCAGLIFHFAALTPVGTTYHIFSMIGTLLMSLGQMALAWDMYIFDHPELQRVSPLWPLFSPLLAGVVLLFLNLPAGLLSILWIFVLGNALWKTHKRSLANIPYSLVKNLLIGQNIFLWLAIVMSLIGWGRLSILVCMIYAATAVSVQQGVGFMRLTNIVFDHLPQEGLKAVFSLVLSLVLPAMLVLVTLACALWIMAYPGGTYLLTRIAHFDFRIGGTNFNILHVLFILSGFYLTKSVISVGRAFIHNLPTHGVRQDLIEPVKVVFTYALWGLFGLATISALGVNLTNLAVVAGGLSVGIGFGMQNIINNFISGLMVIFGQTMREGDVIEVGSNLGTVKKINVRSTMVETPDNAVIFIPNAEFLSGKWTNWTRNGRKVRRSVAVSVAYESNVDQVMSLLKDIALNHRNIARYPAPSVLFLNFGESSLDFKLFYWIDDINKGYQTDTDLRLEIIRTFAEKNISIPFPQLDLRMPDHQKMLTLQKS